MGKLSNTKFTWTKICCLLLLTEDQLRARSRNRVFLTKELKKFKLNNIFSPLQPRSELMLWEIHKVSLLYLNTERRCTVLLGLGLSSEKEVLSPKMWLGTTFEEFGDTESAGKLTQLNWISQHFIQNISIVYQMPNLPTLLLWERYHKASGYCMACCKHDNDLSGERLN